MYQSHANSDPRAELDQAAAASPTLARSPLDAAVSWEGGPEGAPFPTLDAAMAAHIMAALRRTGGVIEGPCGAARLLEINPHTLRARMRKLSIDWSKFRRPPRNGSRQGMPENGKS